ncbi:hypothetical protein TNIN_123181 [Trichonephila inaurata madagascariensis]|uniref:Uncharacterized protein n=1 Tax=Trichonephila inaurata madagascariensis TaxID=2747483 RepID=A0A8X7C8S7_9ARAC|nr:hypothetical protein TNIN_123181 [Trichonephila inaurata madagascariensis]
MIRRCLWTSLDPLHPAVPLYFGGEESLQQPKKEKEIRNSWQQLPNENGLVESAQYTQTCEVDMSPQHSKLTGSFGVSLSYCSNRSLKQNYEKYITLFASRLGP